ncbi:MAG: RsmE family RNA methyltransferase [Acidimicrobiia bacterium]
MKHIPHVVVAAPWDGESLSLSIVQWRHLTKVLRKKSGDVVTYTDGLGTTGSGELGHQEIVRGEETKHSRDREVTVAVAPPANKDRRRFLVEKLAELGVARLVWLETRHGKNRTSSPQKVFSWVLAAVEQSRGAWLMETGSDLIALSDLVGNVVVCEPGGETDPSLDADIVVIGPEGGFAEDEIPVGLPRWELGSNVLRVETAAIVAATRIMSR